MKVPWVKDGPEVLSDAVAQEFAQTPLIRRFATVIMVDGEKNTMALVAIGSDDRPLGITMIKNIAEAKAFATGLMRDAIGIYGVSKSEDHG